MLLVKLNYQPLKKSMVPWLLPCKVYNRLVSERWGYGDSENSARCKTLPTRQYDKDPPMSEKKKLTNALTIIERKLEKRSNVS